MVLLYVFIFGGVLFCLLSGVNVVFLVDMFLLVVEVYVF